MKIGILSRNADLYSTSRLVEAGTEMGHEMRVIDHLKCNLVIEQHRPQVHFKGEDMSDLHAIIPRIGASVTFYGSAVVRQFEMMKVFTATESQALLRSRDKLRSLQILSRAGLGLPKTVFTNYSRDVSDIVDSVGGPPLIIKLLEGTQGLGVVLAENEKAAYSVIEAFHNLKARIIVQEFVKEAKGTDIRVFVVGDKVVASMKRQAREGEFRANVHRGGTVEPYKLNRTEKAAALKAAKAMGLSIAGVDILPSSRGPLILEVNSSPGLQGIERASGNDVAAAIIDFVAANAGKGRIQKDKINA